MRTFFGALIAAGLASILLPFYATAQGATDNELLMGNLPYHSADYSQIDSVDLASRHLTLNIPIISYKQRGRLPDFGFKLIYNSLAYQITYTYADGSSFAHVAPDLQNGIRIKLLNGYANDYYVFPPLFDGSSGLQNYLITDSTNGEHTVGTQTSSTSGETIDGSGLQLGAGIYDRNGIKYSGIVGKSSGDYEIWAENISDPNGNTIVPTTSNGYHVVSWTDSIGRLIPSPGPLGAWSSGCSTFNFPSIGNSTEPYTFCASSHQVTQDFTSVFPYVQAVTYPGPVVLDSVSLPNGTSWSFEYDSYGDISVIHLPTGGSITYVWQNWLNNYSQPDRVIATRTFFDGKTSYTTHYIQVSNVPITTGAALVVRGADGNDTLHIFANDAEDPGQNIEVEVDSFSGQTSTTGLPSYGGTCPGFPSAPNLVKSVKTTYIGTGDDIPGVASQATGRLPSTITTMLDNGQVSREAFTYDNQATWFTFMQANYYGGSPQSVPFSHGNRLTDSEYDYGSCSPGPLLRTTTTTYKWNDGSANASSYLAANLIDLPSKVVVTDSNGNWAAETDYGYDESPSPSGAFGNLTSVTKVNNSGASSTTQTKYNGQGMPVLKTDASGNKTAISSYQCNGLYPQQIVTPYQSSTTLAETTTYSYDCNTGKVNSVTDPNGNPTLYSYNDPLARLTEIQYSDGGDQKFQFNDTPLAVSETQTTQTGEATGPIVRTALFDGLGRKTEDQLTSDPSGTVFQDTTYDPLGRVASTSNPYRQGDPVVYTSTTYDALSRPLTVTKPDNNTTTTTYTGNVVDSWDENGTHMQHTSDALGRLTKVMELGTATQPQSLETDYTYDALNNLKSVNQVGMPGTTPNGFPPSYLESSKGRSFTYDSLSRLITSTNPETGTICYGQWSNGCQGGYDANGNLLFKTDANNLTTQYTYDALNRLLTKSAPDGGNTNFNYTYDTCIAGFPCGNPIGRLVQESNPNGHAGTAFAYDPMGRITNTTWLLYPYSIWLPGMGVNYDLAGNPIWLGYPDGLILEQTYDAAGRLSSITNATQTPALTGVGTVYFSNAQYTPAGALQSATYDNGIITENITYNNRLQPCHTAATSQALPQSTVVGNVYDRLSSYANSPASGSPCGAEPGNNGNIAYIADNVNALWTQSFLYDGLNRLTTASRQDGVYNHTYNYDSFGNLIVQDNVHTNPAYTINAANQLNVLANNLPVYTYDAAGNLTSNGDTGMGGHSYTYNAQSQITSVDGGNTASYFYNGMDERSYKSTSSLQTTYMYLNGQPMSENATSGSGASLTGTWTDYVYANGQKIAKLTTSIYGGITTPNYYLDDHLGTTQVELDASGTPTWYGQFTPFGSELPDGSTSMHYKFTGKERDTESGLDYFSARYFGSNMGRFMSPDPSGLSYADPTNPQSLNLYSYVLNNPLKFTDPSGLECVWDDGSFDSAGDKQTGSHAGCSAQGGTYVDPKAFSTLGAGDWSSKANSDIAAVANALNGSNNFTNVSVNANGSGYIDQTGITLSGGVPYIVKNDYSWKPPLNQQYIQAIAAAAPTICGGGVFAYGGRSLDAGVANGFAGGIVEADTRSGVSKGALFEGGGGEGVVGGAGHIVSSDGGGLGSSSFIYGGPGVEVPFAHAGAGLVGFTNGAGAYGEISAGGREVGVGAYLNITSNAGCHR